MGLKIPRSVVSSGKLLRSPGYEHLYVTSDHTLWKQDENGDRRAVNPLPLTGTHAGGGAIGAGAGVYALMNGWTGGGSTEDAHWNSNSEFETDVTATFRLNVIFFVNSPATGNVFIKLRRDTGGGYADWLGPFDASSAGGFTVGHTWRIPSIALTDGHKYHFHAYFNSTGAAIWVGHTVFDLVRLRGP